MTEPQTPDVLPAGTVLDGAYRLTRLLGQGGMGSVYEAQHMKAGTRVAVKVMHRSLASYPELLARFRREGRVTSDLVHPHVVGVLGSGVAPAGQPYLVMEFLEGEDLQTRLERVGALPLETVVQIVNQLASALGEAHTGGVVHRDLKPDNVFLLRVPDGAVFTKLVDFGLSKLLRPEATQLTVTRAVFGTPEFMSPEQAEGRQEAIDHRSDQWSLACLAWFASTACLPFSGPDLDAVLNQVISAVPTPLGPDAPRLPAEVDKVLRRALSKRRSDRFRTIRAFARAFEAAASAEARPTPAPPPRSAAPEAPRAPALAAPEAKPEPPPRRRGRWIWLALIAALAGGAGWLLRHEPPIWTWLRRARDVLASH